MYDTQQSLVTIEGISLLCMHRGGVPWVKVGSDRNPILRFRPKPNITWLIEKIGARLRERRENSERAARHSKDARFTQSAHEIYAVRTRDLRSPHTRFTQSA